MWYTSIRKAVEMVLYRSSELTIYDIDSAFIVSTELFLFKVPPTDTEFVLQLALEDTLEGGGGRFASSWFRERLRERMEEE